MIKVWCLLRDQFSHVKPVEECMKEEAVFYYDQTWDPDILIQNKPDIVLCVNDWHLDIMRCIDAARRNHIPSLVLQDGILEWRCQYENPKFGFGGGSAQHQPVYADKIACIGAQSTRDIGFWGNSDKVEITGMPKLDYLQDLTFSETNRPGKRLLVMTAKKPWFTEEQKPIILQSLLDIKSFFEGHPSIQVTWRLTKNISELIGVENQINELDTAELVEVLNRVDAVISTPSTAIIEAMITKRPVAYLDYFNTPRFIRACWNISCKEQISSVIEEMLNFDYKKMQHQEISLHDNLYLNQRATERVTQLIKMMVKHSQSILNNRLPWKFPANMLATNGITVETSLNLGKLYPENSIFNNKQLTLLQTQLARSEYENAQLKEMLKSKSLGYWIAKLAQKAISFMKRKGIE